MKKILTVCMSLFLLVAPLANAASPTNDAQNLENMTEQIFIDSSLTISKLKDGRIAPVTNAKNLKEEQLDKILVEMKVSPSKIKEFPLSMKQSIVNQGGVEVPITTTLKKYYNSLDGKKYLVTEKNKEEIAKIKERDAQTLQSQGISIQANMGSESDGIWSAYSSLFYVGRNASNNANLYDYYSNYRWTDMPNFFLWDSIAHAWDTGISSTRTTGNHYHRASQFVGYTQIPMNITRKIGGSKGDLDLQSAYDQQGALVDRLEVSDSYSGLTKQLTASYVHPWIGGIVGVVLSFFSIDWESFTGDEWHWDSTFTVSSNP